MNQNNNRTTIALRPDKIMKIKYQKQTHVNITHQSNNHIFPFILLFINTQEWLTPLPRRLDSYPMEPFTLPLPIDLQYLFLCIIIRIMKQIR